MDKYIELLSKFEARYQSLQKLKGFEASVRAKQAKRAYLDLRKTINSAKEG